MPRVFSPRFFVLPMTPAERIRAALFPSQANPPAATDPTPQPVQWPEIPRSFVTVSEENLAALLRPRTTSIR